MPRQKGFVHIVLLIFLIVGVVLIGGFLLYRNYLVQQSTVMVIEEYTPCDMDRDGDCDKIDYWLAKKALGSCNTDKPRFIFWGYNELADADHDGCVTEEDQQMLFPSAPEVDP